MSSYFEDPFIIIKNHRREQKIRCLSSIKNRKPTTHNWTSKQNLLYLQYLREKISILQCRQSRRITKVFKEMAKFVSTRTPRQAKSHHQKLINKFGTVSMIISMLQQMLSKGCQMIETNNYQNYVSSLQLKQLFPTINYDYEQEFGGDFIKKDKQQLFFEYSIDSFIRISSKSLINDDQSFI